MVCFSFSSDLKPVESNVASWVKKDVMIEDSNVEKKPKQFTKVVWTIGSPIWEEDTWEQPKYLTDSGKNFSEVCAMCKKNIDPSKDVFMYGYLQAFCSEGCREDKIAFDRVFGPPSSPSEGANSKSVIGGTKAPSLNRSKRLYTLEE